MYSAVVLSDQSREALLDDLGDMIPATHSDVVAHHMTICMGPLSKLGLEQLDGTYQELLVTHFACNDKVCAVKVETKVPSSNTIKHITVAVNRNAGGKPKDSNNLTNWVSVAEWNLNLVGTVEEVSS